MASNSLQRVAIYGSEFPLPTTAKTSHSRRASLSNSPERAAGI